MSNTALRQRRSLTTAELRELKAELARASGRFGPDDMRSHAISNAMHRIERGTYGSCTTCSSAIPFERLSVMPETAYCVRCLGTRT